MWEFGLGVCITVGGQWSQKFVMSIWGGLSECENLGLNFFPSPALVNCHYSLQNSFCVQGCGKLRIEMAGYWSNKITHSDDRDIIMA